MASRQLLRREFICRSVLTVPQYLEETNWYIHHGNPHKDIYYTDYWTNITKTSEIKIEDEENFWTGFLSIKIQCECLKPESYCYTRAAPVDDDEINCIPSSNPESQCSYEDCTPQETYEPDFLILSELTETELFPKETISKFDDISGKYLIEETLETENDVQIPQLWQFLSRLQPKPVKDPFCDKTGQPYTEQKLFQNELTFIDDSQIDIELPGETGLEVFDKQILQDSETLLEEIFSPIQCKEDDIVSSSFQDLLESSQPELLSPAGSSKQNQEELFKSDLRGSHLTCEKEEFEHVTIKEENFLEINAKGEKKERGQDKIIESPIFTYNSISSQDYIDDGIKSLACQPYAVPSLKSKRFLLRDSEENYFLSKLWQKEKCYDEDLCIRLPYTEASVKILNVKHTMMNMMKSIKIENESKLGETELKLSWDPFPPTKYKTSELEHWSKKVRKEHVLKPVEEFKVKVLTRKEDENTKCISSIYKDKDIFEPFEENGINISTEMKGPREDAQPTVAEDKLKTFMTPKKGNKSTISQQQMTPKRQYFSSPTATALKSLQGISSPPTKIPCLESSDKFQTTSTTDKHCTVTPIKESTLNNVKELDLLSPDAEMMSMCQSVATSWSVGSSKVSQSSCSMGEVSNNSSPATSPLKSASISTQDIEMLCLSPESYTSRSFHSSPRTTIRTPITQPLTSVTDIASEDRLLEKTMKSTSVSINSNRISVINQNSGTNGRSTPVDENVVSGSNTILLTSKLDSDVKLQPIDPPFSDISESVTMETVDPLELFLSMQEKTIQDKVTMVKDQNKSKMKGKLGSSQDFIISKPILQKPIQFNRINSQCRMVSVQFSGPFCEVLNELEIFVKPYISLLQQTGDIPLSFNYHTTSLDSTRFLLKQKEKQLLDSHINIEKDENYKVVLLLYCIKTTSDNVINSCLESAISQLSLLQEKYSHILQSSLKEIRQKLFHQQYQYQNKNIIHPKILAVCREATNILQRRRTDKIIIVVKRPIMSLMSVLKDCLTVEGFIRPYIVQENDTWEQLKNGNDNCYILCQKKLEDIDLSDILCLFEYESGNDSVIKTVCDSNSVEFVGFMVQGTGLEHSGSIDNHKKPTIENKSVSDKNQSNQYRTINVIGSTMLTQNKDILQILESKYNVLVIERDYTTLTKHSSKSYADIIIDQNQAVILQDLLCLKEEINVEPITRKLASFSFKYKKCWIILFTFDNTKGYPLTSKVTSNLFKLEAALANITNKGQHDISFKVLLCHQREDICCIIREICDMVCTISPHENLERPWLTQTFTKEEKMLLFLPCLNSYSIQLLLKKASITEIIAMSLEQLQRLFPQLPYKVLESCHKAFHNDTGLQLLPASAADDDEFYTLNNNDLEGQDTVSSDSKDARKGQQTDVNSDRYSDINSVKLGDNFKSNKMDLTNSQFSADDNSQEKPNQYILAEMEGRKLNNQQSQLSVDHYDSDIHDGYGYEKEGRYKKNNLNRRLSPSHKAYLRKYFPDKHTANCYSEPNLHTLEMENDYEPFEKEIDNMWRSNQFLQSNDVDKSKRHVPPSSLSSKSRYHSANHLYRKPRQTTPDKVSPSRAKCLPIEGNQMVKRLQENNAIDVSGITIRDKIQLYENNNNNNTKNFVSSPNIYKISEDRPSVKKPDHDSYFRKPAKFSADLTSTTRNLLRRPVLRHSIQNNIFHPSIQKISVGLAQPLRRRSQQYDQGTDEVQLRPPIRRDRPTSLEESPSTDFDQNIPFRQNSIYRSKSEGQYIDRDSAYMSGDETRYLSGDENVSKIKPSKLSYKAKPGQKGGQTVLSFQ